MIKPQLQFFLTDSKIHTVASSACVLPPPENHIYEVFRVISGVALFLEDHLQRLQTSMSEAYIHCDVKILQKDISTLISLNQHTSGNIKIIFWKTNDIVHNMIFYDVHLYPAKEHFQNGIVVGTMQHERKHPNVKLYDSEMRSDALKLINNNNYNEVLLISTDGYITEGSRSNIFFIQKNSIFTTPSDLVLEGVTRKRIISIIRANGLNFHEKKIHVTDLKDYESIFLTGTSRRVLPVRRIEPYAFDFNVSHPVLRNLQEWFIVLCKDYIDSKR